MSSSLGKLGMLEKSLSTLNNGAWYGFSWIYG